MEYKNVTLHLPENVWLRMKRESVREDTTIKNIVCEACLAYCKWIKKTEDLERAEIDLQQTQAELAEIQAELDDLIRERQIAKRARGKWKKAWKKLHMPDPPPDDNKLGTDDNKQETENWL